MRIGFIGLGNMGSAMAANLIKAGHEVTVYNRSRGKVDALAAEGARPADSVAEACGGDVVISMLANDEAVEGIVFGDGGILASLAQDATHVSSSTISVALSERMTTAHAEAGQQFVAAPVFGRPEAARPRSCSLSPRARLRHCKRCRESSTRSVSARSSCPRNPRPPT